MEATCTGAEGATAEFVVENVLPHHHLPSTQQYRCIVRAGKIKVMIELKEPPRIANNGLVIAHETAVVTKLLQRVYPENNPMSVAVVGWGQGYDPDEDPVNGWDGEIHGSICKPYTELLQSTSLEKLAERLLADSQQLTLDYLLRYFEVLLARYQLFPGQSQLGLLLREHLQQREGRQNALSSPFYDYAQGELRSATTDEEQWRLVENGLHADLRCGYFAPSRPV